MSGTEPLTLFTTSRHVLDTKIFQEQVFRTEGEWSTITGMEAMFKLSSLRLYKIIAFILFVFLSFSQGIDAIEFNENKTSGIDEQKVFSQVKPIYTDFLKRCALEDSYCAGDCRDILEHIDQESFPQYWIGVYEIEVPQISWHDIYVIYGDSEVGFEYIIALNKESQDTVELYTCHNTLMQNFANRALYPNEQPVNMNFNKLIAGENIPLENDADIISFIEFYLFITYFSNDYILVQDSEDVFENGITHFKEGERRDEFIKEDGPVLEKIKPIKIQRSGDSIQASFYAWSKDNGFLSHWEIAIENNNGQVSLQILNQGYLNGMKPVGAAWWHSHFLRQ